MRRYLVALCSVCIAAAVAALDLILALSSLDPQDRGIPGQHSPAERLLFFESCITFYGAALVAGRLIYRCLSMPGEADHQDDKQIAAVPSGNGAISCGVRRPVAALDSRRRPQRDRVRHPKRRRATALQNWHFSWNSRSSSG